MRTIILFSDYSQQSAHAGRYAIHLAKKIKANIIVSDAIVHKVDALAEYTGDFAAETDEIQQAEQILADYCTKLEDQLIATTLPGKFIPAISPHSNPFEFSDSTLEFVDHLEADYVIMASNIYYGKTSVMTARNIDTVLNCTKSPLIIVPEDAPIRYPEKYAFVNDISRNNFPFLEQLVSLAEISAAELMLVNINNGRPLDTDQERALCTIMKETSHNVDYGRIYHRYPKNEVKKTDVEWLFEDNRFEAIALVYSETDICKKILSAVKDEKIRGSIDVPLIIFQD
jgi:nucleotide-binding universal stress UspA family protein